MFKCIEYTVNKFIGACFITENTSSVMQLNVLLCFIDSNIRKCVFFEFMVKSVSVFKFIYDKSISEK